MKMKPSILLLTIVGFCSMCFAPGDKPLKMLPKEIREAYAFVPSGTSTIMDETVTIKDFFILNHEVTNLEYREFIHHIAQNDPELAQELTQDTTAWRLTFAYQEPFVQLYHMHPAYNNYPAVGMTHKEAIAYCDFLEESLNSNDADYAYEVSLPTHQEWIFAAKGGFEMSPYPWGGPYLRNAKGCYLANFNRIGEGGITFDRDSGKYELVSNPHGGHGYVASADYFYSTSPAGAFPSNDYEIYDMAGNVAEMVAEEGIIAGGSWRSGGFDVKCESYDSCFVEACDVGFRPIFRLKAK